MDSWQIRKLSAKDSDVNEFKIELVRKLYEDQGIEGKITDVNITMKREPIFNFNFRKLLTLKRNHEEKN